MFALPACILVPAIRMPAIHIDSVGDQMRLSGKASLLNPLKSPPGYAIFKTPIRMSPRVFEAPCPRSSDASFSRFVRSEIVTISFILILLIPSPALRAGLAYLSCRCNLHLLRPLVAKPKILKSQRKLLAHTGVWSMLVSKTLNFAL